MPHYILAPLINVNDEEMVLIEWLKPSGARVRQGEAIAVIETTKSTADLEADREGVLTPLVEPGATVAVGERIAILESGAESGASAPAGADAPSPEGRVAPSPEGRNAPPPASSPPGSWTRRALIMAERRGLDPASLDVQPQDGERVTVSDLEQFLTGSAPQTERRRQSPASPERVLVIGGGGAGIQILDVLARLPHQRAVGVLDDDPALHGQELLGVPVLGRVSDAPDLLEAGGFDAAIVSIGTRVDLRAAIFERLREAGVPFTNVVDPRAAVLSGVQMGVGNAVMPFVQLAAGTRLGDNNFLSSFVDLEHHNSLGSHCTFGPGVMTSGNVSIGDRVKFGAGVFVEPGLSIGGNSVVASGVVLTRSVPANSIVKTKSNFVIRQRDV